MEEKIVTEETKPIAEADSHTPEMADAGPKPAPRRRTATRRVTPKAKAVEETEKTVQTPLVETLVAPVKAKADKAAVVKTSKKDAPAPKKAAPVQHPGILHLKDLVQAAALNLAKTESLTPKLSKQLGKLDMALDKAQKRLRNVRLKEAARAEKYLLKLRERLELLAEGSEISKKDIEATRKSIRSLRQKLSDIKAR